MVAVPVLDGDEAEGPHLESGLLPDLLHGVGGDGLVLVHPAAGKGPQAAALLDQEDLVLPEDGGPDHQLGGLVAGLPAEEVLHPLQGEAGALGHHLGGDLPDALEPLPVKGVFGVLQSRLGQGLELPGPVRPAREGVLIHG